MDRAKRDPALDTLMDPDGQVPVVGEPGDYWVKFELRPVSATRECPHGLRYSLTLHGKHGERFRGLLERRGCRAQAPWLGNDEGC